MGTDCTMVVERKVYTTYPNLNAEFDSNGHYYWGIVGLFNLPRNYDAFDEIRDIANLGYPLNMDFTTRDYLEKFEDWGECWMPFTKFKYEFKKYELIPNIYKKKEHKNLRCIFRFDN